MMSNTCLSFIIPLSPVSLVWSMLQAPGLAGVALFGVRHLRVGHRRRRYAERCQRNDQRDRRDQLLAHLSSFPRCYAHSGAVVTGMTCVCAPGGQVDDVEVDSVWARDRAVDMAEAAVDEASPGLYVVCRHIGLGLLVRHRALDDVDECRPRMRVPTVGAFASSRTC